MKDETKSTKVVTGKVRLGYAHLFEAYSGGEGQDAKYSVCIMIPKGDKATLNKIKDALAAVKATGAAKWGGKVPAGLKMPVRDGDAEDKADHPEYKGHYYINCTSKTKPGLVDQNVNPIMSTEDLYSGCYARVSVNFFAFSTNGNKGIACGLNNVQKLADGDYLGGRSRAEDDFGAWDEDDGPADGDFLN